MHQHTERRHGMPRRHDEDTVRGGQKGKLKTQINHTILSLMNQANVNGDDGLEDVQFKSIVSSMS